MNNNQAFYLLVFGFTFGIFISSFIKIGFSFFLFLLLLSIILFSYNCFFAKSKKQIFFLVILIFSFSLGILRYEIKEIRAEDGKLSSIVGQKIVLTGIIIFEPSLKNESVELVVSTQKVIFADREINTTGRVLITAGLFPEFKYGDEISVTGKLERPENFSTANGKSFDYENYLAKDDIFYKISFAEAELVSSGHGSVIKKWLFDFKNLFMTKINSIIKEPESSLLGGLLLGARNSLGQELQADFRLAGVSHIIALSGYNITIVAEGIMVILSFLPKVLSLTFGVFGIIAFAIMTGGSATVMRASIMALFVLLAKTTNRRYDISRALLLAGVFMLIQNPKILVFDISFQLSFLATIALILVVPVVEKYLSSRLQTGKFRELITATLATQIFVLPFLFYKMGVLSVFALFTNILILPVIPLIMLLGFLSGILGFISLIIATPLAFVCSLLLSYVLKIINIFSHLPLSAVNVGNFSVSLMVLVYVLFIIVIWCEQRFGKKIYEKN